MLAEVEVVGHGVECWWVVFGECWVGILTV